MDRQIDDVQLIQCVENRPELYDPRHVKYMDVNHKVVVWNEIGEELQIDNQVCKQRWSNIRDNYRKSLKKSILLKNRGGKIIKQYKYTDHLQFLKAIIEIDELRDSLAERNNLSASGVKQEDDSQIQIDFRDQFSDEDSSEPSPLQITRNKRKIIQSANSSPQPHSTQRIEPKSEQNEGQELAISPNSVDAFLAGLAPTLKTLSAWNWHYAKSEIFDVVQKYELKTIMGEDYEESSPLLS